MNRGLVQDPPKRTGLLAAGALAVCVGCGGLAAILYGAIGTGALATGVAYGAAPLVIIGLFLLWVSRR